MSLIKYDLNEIFLSIQGEGFNTGMSAVFVRFAGCNKKCEWCDTDFSMKFRMSKEQILNEVEKYPVKNVIITGGEPTFQDIFPLSKRLSRAGYNLYLETNGSNLIDYQYFKWITISPKDKNYKLKVANEMKLVYTGQDINYFLYDSCCAYYYLQPCDGLNNKDELIKIIKNSKDWRLSVQCHKYLNIK
jgi:organic radical activating enzyme